MLSALELIALAKERQGAATDYRIAKLLGVGQSTLGHWLRGRSLPSESMTYQLAQLAGVDPLSAVCWVELERSGDSPESEVWREMLSRIDSAPRHSVAA